MTSGSPFGRLANKAFRGIIQKTMDSGKEDLKTYLETHGVQLSKLTEIGIEEYPAVEALTVSAVSAMAEVAAWFGQSMGQTLILNSRLRTFSRREMPFARYEDLIRQPASSQ
jgi:hypothetical protein